VTLASFHLFVAIKAFFLPPFETILTDWQSIMLKLGCGSRPAAVRTCSTKAALICSHTPILTQSRKYPYTVCQAGKSIGIARHLMPLSAR